MSLLFFKQYPLTQDQWRLELWLKAPGKPWNALEAKLELDMDSPFMVLTGKSALQDWLQKPVYQAPFLEFSGFIPFGRMGNNAALLLQIDKKDPWPDFIRVHGGRLLQHDGEASPLWLMPNSQNLPVKMEKKAPSASSGSNLGQIEDTMPPYAFYPKVEQNAEGESYITFRTSDDHSGVDFYLFLFEDKHKKKFEDPGVYWLQEYPALPLEVWTYDKVGNIQKEWVDYPSQKAQWFFTKAFLNDKWLIFVVLCIILVINHLRKKKKSLK